MRIKLLVLILTFHFSMGFLYPGLSLQNKKQKVQEMRGQHSLIKKELLIPPDKSLTPPKRNIFTRQRASTFMNDSSLPGNFQAPEQKKSPALPESAAVETSANVKYIGYVKSGKRVVALIILEGETYAVESGDVLETGMTIGEITPDDMEIFDKGSEPKRINLEGEWP
jgi:hypothetical protein